MSRAWRVFCFVFLSLATSCASRGDAEIERSPADASLAETGAATSDSDVAVHTSAAGIVDPLTLTADGHGAFTARHAWHRFSTTIDARGASLDGLGSAWHLGLRLARIGREGAMREVGRPAPTMREGRVRFEHEGVSEWYLHDSRGLEQGFEIAERPSGEGALIVEVGIDGLEPVMGKDGKSIELRDPNARARVTYADLLVRDAVGRIVDAARRVGERQIEIT
ncbi:MAG: hypothetical protein ACHREM_27935, partial [Polyangiales bacterium]